MEEVLAVRMAEEDLHLNLSYTIQSSKFKFEEFSLILFCGSQARQIRWKKR
jgi:hypothetical protein